MLDLFIDWHDYLLGLGVVELTLLHMVMRAAVVYILGIIILNLINKRFIGEKTSFDVILTFISGSSLASAIVGGSPYWPTLGMVFFLVILNWFFALLSFHNVRIEKLLKGSTEVLYADGKLQWKTMHRYHFTEADIVSEVRKDSGLSSLDDVEMVILESSGEISVIPKKGLKASHRLQHPFDSD